jgi:hypothetical protein
MHNTLKCEVNLNFKIVFTWILGLHKAIYNQRSSSHRITVSNHLYNESERGEDTDVLYNNAANC